MHFLRHITVWMLCAVMLGTQPSLTYAAETLTSGADTYPLTKSNAEQQTQEDSSTDQVDTTEESKDDSESNSSEGSSSIGEETGSSSASTIETSESISSEETESLDETENTENTEKTTNTKETTTTPADTPSNTSSSETSEKSTTKEKDTRSSSKRKNSETDAQKSSDEKNDKKNSKKISDNTEEKMELKKLDGTIVDEDDSAEKDEDPSSIIPKIYGTSPIITRDDAEYMGDFVYFNQTDSAWNENGYQIASAGCGPTSMAVVISSLTDAWVTPVDATVWAYEHGYYSTSGSAHALIPAMADAYGLNCKGAGTDYASIKKALKNGKPVVALMGPGYFTRKGHFMVLIGIDKNDNVTVADVGSRQRSAYKYALSDIINQSKSASAGGPFWIISKSKKKKKENENVSVTYTSPQNDYVIHVKEGTKEKAITFHLGDKVSYHGVYGLIVKFENRKAYILGKNGKLLTTSEGETVIPLSELQMTKEASPIIHGAITAILEQKFNSLHKTS